MNLRRIDVMSDVLAEATPYIQKYKNKTIVVKYGGHAMQDPALKAAVMSDLSLLCLLGIRVVLVHGGGPEINEQLLRLGKKSEFVNGLRVTDDETMEVVQQMLAGKVNKDLVSLLKGQGIGLCGLDGGMMLCQKLQSEKDLGHVGEIIEVDPTLLNFSLNSGFIPVIATIGADKAGTPYNINADTAASKIALSLNASKLIIMTDVAGLLRIPKDESTLIEEIDIQDVDELIQSGVVTKGMIPKVLCCVDSLQNGLPEAAIIDGRLPHSVLLELFSNAGSGTLFVKQ